MIKQFKEANKKNRSFLNMANKMLKAFNEYRINKYENILHEKANSAFLEFQKRHSYYEGDEEDIISWALNDEVLKAFITQGEYNYDCFVRDLAISESLKEVTRHFHNYYNYYQLIYELNKYEYFYLIDFQGGGYENSSAYNEMLDVKYPKRIDERKEAERVEKSKRKGGKPALSIKNKDELSIEEIDAVEIINSFSDGERALLFAIFNDENKKNNLAEIPLTEFIRFAKIIGSYEDLSIFKKNVKNSTFYSMANKGISYYTATHGQKELIEDTKAKLQKLKVPFMVRFLSKLLLELL
ncbi:hypothetical protein QWY92_16055 [Algibacter miyuki]|nr:hypothetical protein [Algibacter miyuki]